MSEKALGPCCLDCDLKGEGAAVQGMRSVRGSVCDDSEQGPRTRLHSNKSGSAIYQLCGLREVT